MRPTKRACADQSLDIPALDPPAGRDQLLLVSPELQSRCGQRYCDEAELLPLLLSHGVVRRVRTIAVSVRPLGGDNFNITLGAALPTVGEAKAEIARVQGTKEYVQELYKVASRVDGKAVREDDAEPQLLDDDEQLLGDGELVAMVVKEALIWRTYPAGYVTLSEEGGLATNFEGSEGLATSGMELTEGRHYWEVEVMGGTLHIGVARPNLDPTGMYIGSCCTDGWFIELYHGSLLGNGKYMDDGAGRIKNGDRVGVLLDLNKGSILFFKNCVQHGPGYAAGSVTGPVVHAAQFSLAICGSARLIGGAAWPAGHAQ
jgi:hypothetical protein